VLVGPSGWEIDSSADDCWAGNRHRWKTHWDVLVNDVPQRDVAMVFQNYALSLMRGSEHRLRVKMRKADPKTIQERVETVARLSIDHLDRKPRQLSGGQQQRVALGRACVNRSIFYLMNLCRIRCPVEGRYKAEIKQLHHQLGITTVSLTDQVEAMTLADQMVVLNQHGSTNRRSAKYLYSTINRMVATFLAIHR